MSRHRVRGGIACVAAFLSPNVVGTNVSAPVLALGFLIAVVLHLIGQGLLTAWRSED